jgi:hypothetical protein
MSLTAEAAVKTVHDNGGQVYVSLGGTVSSYQQKITTFTEANDFIHELAAALHEYEIDGVDFNSMDPAASASTMEHMIKRLKYKYPAFKIRFTIPSIGMSFDPWRTVLVNAIDKIDYVQTLYYDYYWLGFGLLTSTSSPSQSLTGK